MLRTQAAPSKYFRWKGTSAHATGLASKAAMAHTKQARLELSKGDPANPQP